MRASNPCLREAIAARDVPRSRPIADFLIERVRTPASKARALAALASIHLLDKQPQSAAHALALFVEVGAGLAFILRNGIFRLFDLLEFVFGRLLALLPFLD